MKLTDKQKKEQELVGRMIGIYCKGKKHSRAATCAECAELMEYAVKRIASCPDTETKTFCSNCKTHCFAPVMRESIRAVMRYSGPRMLFFDPVILIKHIYHKKRRGRV